MLVDKPAAKFLIAQRAAHRMNHAAAGIPFFRNVPDFLTPAAKTWDLLSLFQVESLD